MLCNITTMTKTKYVDIDKTQKISNFRDFQNLFGYPVKIVSILYSTILYYTYYTILYTIYAL